MKKKLETIINFILDESGSMGDIRDSVISGFNEYVQGLKKEKSKILFTLTKFDSRGIRIPYSLVDVRKVEKLSKTTYQPGEMTPLYDAVVETIEKVADDIKPNQKSVVVIMTDGLENASREHDEHCLRELIKKLEKRGNWTFAYLGANQDSWAVAAKFGIARGNVMDWDATDEGTVMAFASNTSSAVNFARGSAMNTKNYFEKKGK